MKTISIIIASHSPIIALGIETIVRSFRRFNMVVEQIAPAELEEAVTQNPPSLLFVDVSETLPPLPSKTVVAGLTHSLLSRDAKRRFNSLVSVYSTAEDIEKIVESASRNRDREPERSELTPREIEVVKGIVLGLSNKEIAAKINVSVNTVMTHRRNIASKLQIHSSAGLTIYAIASKLIDLDDVRSSVY